MFAYVLVGLGNPGQRYSKTRHNLGFEIVDTVAARCPNTAFQSKFQSLVADCEMEGKRIFIVKPQTFMNLSGQAVREVADFYKMAPDQIVVVFDDLDLPLADIRIRKFGGAGGHNGVSSIIDALGTDQFPRIRVGIGKGGEAVDRVLSGFSPTERDPISKTIERSADAIQSLVRDGINKAMNTFNQAVNSVNQKEEP